MPVKNIVASLHPHTLAILCVYNDENFTSSKCFKYFLVKLLKVSLIHLDNWFVSFGPGKDKGLHVKSLQAYLDLVFGETIQGYYNYISRKPRPILLSQLINKSHKIIRAKGKTCLICSLWLEKWQKENWPGPSRSLLCVFVLVLTLKHWPLYI